MTLDNRLSACAEFIEKDSVVADIGTDHAYLPVYLVKNGICKKAVAADIGTGPLDAAKKNIAKYLLEDKISTYLSDGLKEVPKEDITHIVIAGMGGETICRILEECSWISQCVLILQPMSKSELLRDWLISRGFEIQKEKAVVDGKFIYTVMKCVFSGEKRQADDVEITVGGLDLTDKAAAEYISRKIFTLEKSAQGKLKSQASKEQGEADITLAKKLRELIQLI